MTNKTDNKTRLIGVSWEVILFAALAAAVFFIGVEAALLLPFHQGDATQRLSSSEIIALAGGMITSAGLVAIYMQFRQSRDAARKAIEDAQALRLQETRTAALRADQLHVEWNVAAMHRHRELAWHYFVFLDKQPDQWEPLGRSWVLSAPPPDVPADAIAPDRGLPPFAPYNWALSSITAFFVRLQVHLDLDHSLESEKPEDLAVLIGPFFWNHWCPYLLRLCEVCEAAYDEDQAKSAKDERKAKDWPYFIDPIRALHERTRDIGHRRPTH